MNDVYASWRRLPQKLREIQEKQFDANAKATQVDFMWIDRQTDRSTDRQTDRQTDRMITFGQKAQPRHNNRCIGLGRVCKQE